MDRVADDVAAQGRNLLIAYCPDRCTEGHGWTELLRHPQLVAGTTPLLTRQAGGFGAWV